MRRDDFDLSELLRFEPEQGRILLKDYRMIMLSAVALGCLRQELIATVGWDQARGLMKRFGHAAGLADGRALAERFPEAGPDRQMDLGPALHALEGVARIVRDTHRSRIDLARGRYHVEAYWEESYEAEQHLATLGPSEVPVCWTLVGYAAGHSAAAAGRETVVLETECRAMGHPRCRFVVGLADAMPDAAARERADYAAQNLPEVLDDLLATIREQKRSLRSKERALSQLQTELSARQADPELIGESLALQRVLELARRVAPVDTTVLILGESGTGKERLAQSIHRHSTRAEKPFVAVNCSALPESLQEAELFGYKQGAFTGAVEDRQGLFEAAHGGTLFLDEIGDLAPTAQTKILRALQEGEVRRLGETAARRVDVRVLAATHRDLEAMTEQRGFRDDLYYRLSVISVTLPPLRERGDDVLLLARHFLKTYAARFDKPVRELSRAAACALSEYRWPGNVRELQNAVQRGVVLAQGERIELEDLPENVWRRGRGRAARAATPSSPEPRTTSPDGEPLHAIQDPRRRTQRALELAEGHRDRAARMLGISRTTLWRRIKRYGLA